MHRIFAVLLLAVTAAGCGRGGDVPAYPRGAADVVVRVTRLPGLGAPTGAAGVTPAYTLYGDGRLVRADTADARWPVLRERRLDDAAAGRLVGAALAAMEPARSPDPVVADGGAITIVVRTDGETRTAEIPGVSERGDRLFARFRAAAGQGQEREYAPTAVAAIAAPGGGGTTPAGRWPATSARTPYRSGWCALLTGVDLATVRSARESTWVAGGRLWYVAFRPLLPTEIGCPPG